MPHPDVVVTRASIVECNINVDREGPDFTLTTVHGTDNCYTSNDK